MRIDGLPPAMLQALLAAASPKIERAATAAFADGVAPAAPPQVPSLPHAATSVQMLVALSAAAEPASERRRRTAADADRGLSMLERLHAELVAGSAAPERLRELAAWSDTFTAPDEPGLAELAREVEVRVRVELAKHEMRA